MQFRIVLLFLVVVTKHISSLNLKLLEIEKNPLSDVMKQFIKFVISQNAREKDGFLFIKINWVEPEFCDFTMQKLNKNSSLTIVNFEEDKIYKPMLHPNHFKIVLCDPEGDLSDAEASFNKVRASRAKILLILTKPPIPIFITYILNSYWKIQCINVIIAYESNGSVEVWTMNPFLPNDKYVNLTETKYKVNLFNEKASNLYGYTIKALLTYSDKTKVEIVNNQFSGKDFTAIQTIFEHLKGNLKILYLESTPENPWIDTISNATETKQEILKRHEISLLIKSESFTINDGIVENLYPHTQNDLVAIVPKSPLMPLLNTIMTLWDIYVWLLLILLLFVFFFLILILTKENQHYFSIFFQVWRLLIMNNTYRIGGSPLTRVLLLNCLLFGLVFNLAFQSKMSSVLTIRGFEPDINTIDKLINSKLKLHAIPLQINELTKKYSGTANQDFIKSLIPFDFNEGQLQKSLSITSLNQSFLPKSFITEEDIAKFIVEHRVYRQDKYPLYHLVQESLMPSYQAFKVNHGSPLLTVINKELRKLSEGGFIQLWNDRSIHKANIEGILISDSLNKDLIEPLSLELLDIYFYFLGSGYLVAVITFIIELHF